MPADSAVPTRTSAAGEPGCPKAMEYGPCGGVGLDGLCEVSPEPCVFLERPTVVWHGPTREARHHDGAEAMRTRLARGRVVIADLPAAPLSADAIAECGEIMRDTVDAVLGGDSGFARVQFPPSYRARLVMEAGLTSWVGLNNRDRNRVAIEAELAALAHVGVAAVHCVTGDHTLTGNRPDAMPVFDLDSTRTAALARSFGHLVSVGESPAAPPAERRPARLLQKQVAGAEVCFVDHCGGVEAVRRFVGGAQELGVTMSFIVCIPVVVDERSAAVLESFTGMVLPPGYLDRIRRASDVRAAGVEAAIELSEAMLKLDGIDGVNLSGAAPATDLAAIGIALRG